MKKPPPPLLLVDDELDDLIVLRRLLLKAGVPNPITTAEDGRIAQRLLHAALTDPSLTPAAVFCDVRLNGVDGLSLVRWARTHRPFDKVKLVLLTGFYDRALTRTATAAGADGCFEKFPSANVLKHFIAGRV